MLATATAIVRRLREAGHVAYFAGGCVRDRLRGVPAHDIDIATDARPEEVAGLFRRTIPVGAQFGVMIVVEHGQQFEIATFRTEGGYLDGRRPDTVEFSDAKNDARRRDFTVNGLFFDPVGERVIDHVGGVADLESRTLRAIGDPAERIAEDKLRILRAVRFAATLDFEIDPATWDAVLKSAPEIHVVSPERIRDELVKIFTSPQRVRGFDLLDSSGLLRLLLPEVADLRGCEQPPEFHPEGDVFVHTRIMLELLPPAVSPALALGVLFHDIGKPPTSFTDETGRIRFNGHEHVGADMASGILRRLRFSNNQIDDVIALVRNHMAFKDVRNMRVAKLKRFLDRETIDDELELHRVDCSSSHGMLDNHVFLIEKREEFANEPLVPPPFVTGHDLIQLGLRPGPPFKQILDTAHTAQLEGAFADRAAALDWLRDVVEAK